MKKILLILVSILSILTLTACGKTDEELDKEFDDKVYNTLINYSAKVYDNNQYQKYQILDNQYYIFSRKNYFQKVQLYVLHSTYKYVTLHC